MGDNRSMRNLKACSRMAPGNASAILDCLPYTMKRRKQGQTRAVGVGPTTTLLINRSLTKKIVWTCQKDKDDESRCKFFLWDSEARPREQNALQNNSRTEPNRPDDTPARPHTRSRVVTSPPPPYSVEAAAAQSARKRSRVGFENEDEYGLEQGDSGFDDELDRVMTAVETPRKAARTDANTTPRRKLPWENTANGIHGIPTPQTERRGPNDPFATRFSRPGGSLLTPSKIKEPEGDDHYALTPSSSPFETPSPPTRFKDVAANSEDTLVRGVFKLLGEQHVHLPEQAETALRKLLARQAEGKKRGLELLRKEIKAKEAKITELTHRNNTLQAELEAARATVEHLNWENEEESEL